MVHTKLFTIPMKKISYCLFRFKKCLFFLLGTEKSAIKNSLETRGKGTKIHFWDSDPCNLKTSELKRVPSKTL